MKKISPIIRWWVTPKLPYHDIFELPLLINESRMARYLHIFSRWVIHPIKRRLARWYLGFLQRRTDIKVIGITGSAGKTTTKEMLFSILKKQDKTVCTRTYLDPVYNIPNTILATPIGTKYLILEMGVEYPGEMDFYLWLAKPDIGVITNIFPTHTEFLGDISGVFEEKIKLVLGLSKEGMAVLNSGDKMLKSLSDKLAAEIIWFRPDVDPMIQNANTAKVLAKSLEVSDKNIKDGLATYKKPAHRLAIINHESGAMILDDSYNSNPLAALSTLEYFNKIAKGKKIAVLGDMLELGNYDEDAHRELGRSVANAGFEIVVGVGKSSRFLIDEVNRHSKKTKTYLLDNVDDATPIVKRELGKNVSILVKGSRSIHLDKLIDSLH
jgi:UDP-N-acetylmuramoyl-tripeptide--D-alanyl-D-alanine ligase